MPRKSPSRPIAERSLQLLLPTGKRVSFRVTFGPIRKVRRDFGCPVRFYGWGNSPPDIWGADSLQAFTLAITLVHSILDTVVQRGGRVLWPGSGTDLDYDLDNFLTSPNRPSRIARKRVRKGRR